MIMCGPLRVDVEDAPFGEDPAFLGLIAGGEEDEEDEDCELVHGVHQDEAPHQEI